MFAPASEKNWVIAQAILRSLAIPNITAFLPFRSIVYMFFPIVIRNKSRYMKTYIYKYVQSVVPITCEGYITLLKFLSIGDSSNGRTADSDSVSIGSNPISPAKNHRNILYIDMLCPPILVSVTVGNLKRPALQERLPN